ncbi:MAG: hypothetical protein RLZZ272_1042 [Actinomycetota bacterium]|jgi:predicted dienelactone hydrolase
MRPLEWVVVGLVLGAAVALGRTAPGRPGSDAPGIRDRIHRGLSPTAALLLAGAVALAVGLQASIEGTRWQLLPAQVAAAGAVALLLARAAGRGASRTPRAVAALAALAALLGGAVGWTLPVEVLPPPSGPQRVGTTTAWLVDPDRTERQGPTPGGPREFVVQLWYPADPAAPVERARWMAEADVFARDGARELGLPSFALDHLALIEANATADATPAAGRHPLVVLSHGWTGFRGLQVDLAEELASHGYVVAAVDHPYSALATVLADGTVAAVDPEMLPEFGTVPDDDYARASRTLVATHAADLVTLLDLLEAGAEDPRVLRAGTVGLLEGHIEPTRVALVGHSTGGGGAVAACADEPRCAAVVGFDPWVEPAPERVLAEGLAVPLLSLRTEDWIGEPNEAVLARLHAATVAAGAPELRVALAGALHRDVTLISALSPLAAPLGLEGTTPGRLTRSAVRAWTRAFLDHHLRGTGPDPGVAPPDAPNATLTGPGPS